MPPTIDLLATLSGVAGADAVRPGTADDAVEGVRPEAVVEADTAEGVARVLAAATEARLSVVVRGGGTKLSWGRQPAPIDILLGTRRLSRVIAHAHGDLTVEVEAGVELDALNRQLREHGQWLPLESPFERATIGGILATNEAGPARHRYGTPRDLLIGVRLATADGQIVKAGGNVVKNVAGYDLGKLVTGSFGTLAVIVGATFKLTPAAAATATHRFVFDDRLAAAGAAHAIAASQLDPVALDLRSGDGVELLVRFASDPAVVAAQIHKTIRLMARFEPRAQENATGAAEEALWASQSRRPWEGDGAVLKLHWLPASLETLLDLVHTMPAPLELTARAGLGVGLLRVDGDAGRQLDIVRRLRAASDVCSRATILRADPAVKTAVDVWQGRTDSARLHAAVKAALDPAGILNAGRGPI
jgi:glycolate oxidase FAD binding subunit